MAMSPSLVWEVRTTGNAANGGAFRAGSSGVDYSQQDTAQVTYADLTVDATTNTSVTSSANPFTSAHVGNVIRISSTSPWSPGYYEVMSVTSRVATLDRSPAATGSAGGIGKLGGAADHPATIAGAVVASNVVWIKAGTYAVGSAVSFTAALSPPTNTAPATRLCGYGTARGDAGRAVLSSSGFFGTVLSTGAGWYVANLEVNAAGSRIGITVGQYSAVYSCKIYGAIVFGLNIAASNCTSMGNEITGCSGTAALNHGGTALCLSNNVHDNTTVGIATTFNSVISRNLVTNNTGATSDGIAVGGALAETVVTHNTVHGNGRNGLIYTAGTQYVPQQVQNNIFSSNGGYGAVFASAAGIPALPTADGNAYYANTSGARSNGNDTTINPQNASGAYTNPLDKILTVSPFVNAAAGDFSLNNTAGGGVACRGAGAPASWPGTTVANSLDVGAAQHQASVASAGGGRVIGSGMIQPAARRS